MADSLLVLVRHEQAHRGLSLGILKHSGILSPDGIKSRAVNNVKLIDNSPSAAKAATAEVAWETGPVKPALLNGQRI